MEPGVYKIPRHGTLSTQDLGSAQAGGTEALFLELCVHMLRVFVHMCVCTCMSVHVRVCLCVCLHMSV